MAIIHWKTGVDGQFTDPSKWSGNRVPGANDDVVIAAPGTYTVTVDANVTIRSLSTVSTATLAITGHHTFVITDGTIGTGNAGTISVGDSAALQIGGTFRNDGSILLSSSERSTGIGIAANTVLTGNGQVVLSDSSGNVIGGISRNPFLPVFFTLTNAGNTIEGAGTIGTNLALNNEGRIIGDGTLAALILNTGFRTITNSGVVAGTTAEGVVLASNVLNSGLLEANGANARLQIDGVITDTAPVFKFPFLNLPFLNFPAFKLGGGRVTASGEGAHVDLSSASIRGGTLGLGAGTVADTVAGSGSSLLLNLAVTGAGTLEANPFTTLSITNSSISTTATLMSNGFGSGLIVNGNVGAVASTINGGEIEFNGASAAKVTFQGTVGTLKLDSTFTGTVSGLSGPVTMSFSNFFVFGDSTVDSGALQYLSPLLGDPDLTARLQNALANGGTDSPVGVGQMNVQYLAARFGLTANTAYTTDGRVAGGGTDYAISGAFDAADNGSGNDPGNGGLTNSFQETTGEINPALLSTVGQIQTYLSSMGGVADPSALYLISSGANDSAYARNNLTPTQQQAYLAAQAQTLATEIEALFHAGAQRIVVNDIMNNRNISLDYSRDLYDDLDASGIVYTKSDVHEMVQTVMKNPGTYGFTPSTVVTTNPALIEPDPSTSNNDQTGYGLWGANTTTQEGSSVPLIDQYSFLKPPDNPQQPQLSAEETHFFSDDQHLSDAGQKIQATFDFNLISDDLIDLANLQYDPLRTNVSFSGDTAGGTLTVSNGSQSVNISLLGNYMAASFATASDGTIDANGNTGTLVMDTGNTQQLLLATAPH